VTTTIPKSNPVGKPSDLLPVTTVDGFGRVPHVRLSVHPDFLSSFLALANSMRLSLMKAAHASVRGASRRKSGTMGRKWILRMLLLQAQELLLLAVCPCHVAVALEGAAPHKR
jgi:hypothetical protein